MSATLPLLPIPQRSLRLRSCLLRRRMIAASWMPRSSCPATPSLSPWPSTSAEGALPRVFFPLAGLTIRCARRCIALRSGGKSDPHGLRASLLTVLHTERERRTLETVKTNTVGIRLEPALLDRLDVVAARWSATSPIPITYDRSTIVRGLMQRALILVEAELGITPAVATTPADRPAVIRSAKPVKSAKSVKSAKRGR